MEMTSLRKLHKSMLSIGVDMQQFQIITGAANFDCLFSVREVPFVLSLTSRGASPKFFKFNVQSGYSIRPYFDGFFYDLVEVLSNNANSKVRLEPKKFLEQLNSSLPVVASPNNVPLPKKIIQLRPDITENRDKPFFDTWIYWKSEHRKGATSENLQKTMALLGKEAFDYSISMKASSRWSVIDLKNDWKR